MKKKTWIPIAIAAVVIAGVLIGVNFLVGSNDTNPDNGVPSGNNSTNNSTPEWQGKNTSAISLGKVFVDNYVPGESDQDTLSIYNGNDFDATFSVDYRVPDWVGENYSRPTEQVRDWVWISNRKPLVRAHETYIVEISLGMSSTAIPPGDKWEFWIGVIDQSQAGFVQVELCQRWLITMA